MQTPKPRPGSLEVPQKKLPTATPRTARKLKTAEADPVSSPNQKIRTSKTQSPKVVADRRFPKTPVHEKQRSDTMTCLPKPLLADGVETSLPKDSVGEPNREKDKEDEESVKQLSGSDILKRHVDRAKMSALD